MADEKTREPAAVWYTHVGRQVWRVYGRHPKTLRPLDVADEHQAADAVMRDLDRLATLDAALDGVAVTADELRQRMRWAESVSESAERAHAAADEAGRERDQAVKAAKAAERECAAAVEDEKHTYDLHKQLCDANDRPSVRRLLMWLGLDGRESYTSWLGLVK